MAGFLPIGLRQGSDSRLLFLIKGIVQSEIVLFFFFFLSQMDKHMVSLAWYSMVHQKYYWSFLIFKGICTKHCMIYTKILIDRWNGKNVEENEHFGRWGWILWEDSFDNGNDEHWFQMQLTRPIDNWNGVWKLPLWISIQWSFRRNSLRRYIRTCNKYKWI